MCFLAAHLDLANVKDFINRDIVRRFADFLAASGGGAVLANYGSASRLGGAGDDPPGGPLQPGADCKDSHAADKGSRERFQRKSFGPRRWNRRALHYRKLGSITHIELLTAGTAEVVREVTGCIATGAAYWFHGREYSTRARSVGGGAGADFLAYLDVADDVGSVDQADKQLPSTNGTWLMLPDVISTSTAGRSSLISALRSCENGVIARKTVVSGHFFAGHFAEV